MERPETFVVLVLLTSSLVAMLYAGIQFLTILPNMLKAITNTTGRYSYILGPFVLFMPSQFNEAGNAARVRLLAGLGKVLLAFGIGFGCYGIAIWLGGPNYA